MSKPSVPAIPRAYCNLSTLSVKEMPVSSSTELPNGQQEDPGISKVWSALSHGDATQVEKTKHRTCPLLLRERDWLKIPQGIMYQITSLPGKPCPGHYQSLYAQAFPMRDQKASTVAKLLIEKYFVHYG